MCTDVAIKCVRESEHRLFASKVTSISKTIDPVGIQGRAQGGQCPPPPLWPKGKIFCAIVGPR